MTARACTAEDLDAAFSRGCEHPGCTSCKDASEPLFVRPRCHPRAACSVAYGSGVLFVACGECSRPIFSAHVARKMGKGPRRCRVR